MFICEDLRLEKWQPDFSGSGQGNPEEWTRVFCGDTQITNSLEWVEWTDNPVQVLLCETCGHAGCASGGYVHVSRLGDFVLFSPAQQTEFEAPRFIRSRGALAIPVALWNQWAVPKADRLARANYAAVADAWITGPARSAESIVAHLRDRLVGGDTLEKNDAIRLVEDVLTTIQHRAADTFEEPLISPATVGARPEKLYFDGPSELDWNAFAFAGGATYLLLNDQHMTRVP